MINVDKYQYAIDRIKELTYNQISESSKEEFEVRSKEFAKLLQDSQLVKVPLVGVFNAGKSSLLNVLLGAPNLLPIDNLPETAIAYELYYDLNERVELYREDKEINQIDIASIKQLKTEPGDLAKVYVDNEIIKNLQERGIVLVDMPGIGSGLERHDAAIFKYIETGSAFVLIVDAEHGALRVSTLFFLDELSRYNLSPSILISKTDKKPAEEVAEIVEYVRYQISKTGVENPYISTVCSVNKDVKGLEAYLDTLDANALVAQRVGAVLKTIISSVVSQLKMRVNLRSIDIENIEDKLQKVEEELSKVKEESEIDSSNADTPEKSTQDILDNIRTAFKAKASDIANMVVAGESEETIHSAIIGVIRAEIITSLKEESMQYSSAIADNTRESIQTITNISLNTDDVVFDFSEVIGEATKYISTIVTKLPGVWGKILLLAIRYLPDALMNIFNNFFGRSKEDKAEEIRKKLTNSVLDQIIENIRPTIFDLVVNNQKSIRQAMHSEMVRNVNRIKEGLKEKIADAQKSKSEVEKEIMTLNNAIIELNTLNQTI